MMRLFVPGTPVPQGSLRSGGRGQMFYSNASTLKPWRQSIANAIADNLGTEHEPLDAPIKAVMTFYFPPLKKPKPFKLSAPDLDKLVRTVLDAVTMSTYAIDDSRVVWIDARKKYADDDHPPGVALELSVVRE